jgi:hypothetical protein
MTALDDVIAAKRAVYDARMKMRDIREPSPVWLRGPTAEDNCEQVFSMIEHALDMLHVYLKGTPE